MTDKIKRKAIESAMRDGTILGMLWIATFSVSIVMLKSIGNGGGLILSLAVTVLTLSSPILAYKLAVKHRNSECNGTIGYGEAWIHIFVMYLCAILLSSIIQFIFYAYIDPHIFGDLIPAFAKLAAESGLGTNDIEIFTQLFAEMEKMSAAEIVMSQLGGHVTRSIILTTFIAIAVKKNPEKNI